MGLFYEMDKNFGDVLKEKKNFLFIGEAGSGKSEIVLNVAAKLARETGKKVDLFDMDQTKPLYRSRDMAEDFKELGVDIHYQDQFLDAPTAVSGVATSLMADHYTLMDIGGGSPAARMAGAYAHILKNEDSIDGTMSSILKAVNLDHIYMLGNPNLGYHTSAQDFLEGLEKMDSLLEGITTINSACVKKDVYEEVKGETDRYLLPIELYLTYEWVDR